MSLRVLAITAISMWLIRLSYRDWYKALCGTIVILSVLEHPSMPRSAMGIPGLNLFNILLLFILYNYFQQRGPKKIHPPPYLKRAFFFFITVIVISFSRLLINPTSYIEFSLTSTTVDQLVNPLKFLIPGVLLFKGCDSDERARLASICIISVYTLLAIQIIKTMGLNFSISGDELSSRAARVLVRDVGLHRVDLAMMMGGGFAATYALSRQLSNTKIKLMLYASCSIILLALAMTGGRTGLATCVIITFFMSCIQWRKLLPLFPIAGIALIAILPGVKERFLQGFATDQGVIAEQNDSSSITSGRTDIWPEVIKKIKERPLVGYGKLAMKRTGLTEWAAVVLRDVFGHPHNAYLEMLLDNGIIGFIFAMPIYFIVVWHSFKLFKRRESKLQESIGGISLSLMLALLIGSFGAQTLYPRESAILIWASAGLALRLSLDKKGLKERTLDGPHERGILQ